MSGPLLRSAIATCAVCAIGTTAFAAVTHGFTTLTSESARRLDVIRSPRALPAIQGVDQDGRHRGLFVDAENPATHARVTIVDFIYTRCVSVCSQLGDRYQQLQAVILARHLEHAVRLVTVSFDPKHDTADALAAYATRMHIDTRVWTLVVPADPERLPDLLSAFGVVVLPAPLEQFQHNAAFHVLDRSGRLARIVDIDDRDGVLDAALSLMAAVRPPA